MRRIESLYSLRTAACTAFLALSLLASGALPGQAKEKVLYQFSGGADGNAPMASMVADVAGNLYGTTSMGGGGANCASGCGTVFELSPPAQQGGPWTETVLYSFQGGNDGSTPAAPMIADGSGNLFGTASQGGDGNCSNQEMSGCGIVFELTPPRHKGGRWTETLLYSFQGIPSAREMAIWLGRTGSFPVGQAISMALPTMAGTVPPTKRGHIAGAGASA